MAWITKGEELAPVRYNVTINDYNHLPKMSEAEIKRKSDDWLAHLLENIGDLRGWWLNGAYNISRVTSNFSRPHTNTDIAILVDENPQLLKIMTDRLKNLGLFLFKREKSEVPVIENGRLFPEIKHEMFILADPEKVVSNRVRNKDYMFCEIDSDGQIIERNSIETRVRIFAHILNPKTDSLVSIEDQREIPAGYLNYTHKEGKLLANSSDGKKIVLSTDIRYMVPIYEEAIKSLNNSWFHRMVNADHLVYRIAKNQRSLDAINRHLSKHPSYSSKKDVKKP